MIRTAGTVALGAFLAVAAPSASALAQDASDWSQFQGTSEHTGAADGPEPPYRQVWESTVDADQGDALAGPVVSGDTVVVVAPQSVVALDAANGTERWTVEREGAALVPAIADVGGSAAVVYADGDDAETAALVAVALEDGSPVWERPLEAEATSGVTTLEGRAFVVDDDGTMYAVDLDEGAVAWTHRISGVVLGPPAGSDGRVFVVAGSSEAGGSARIVALDAETGEAPWPAAVPDVAAAFGSIAAVSDDELVVALQDGVVYALSTNEGSASWSVRVSALVSPISSPAVADGAVFVADRTGGLHRMQASGREWLFAFNEGVVRQSPIVVGDVVILGFEDGGIGAVRASTGRMIFRTPSTGVPVMGIAVAGDTIAVAYGDSGPPHVVGLANDPGGTLVDVASPTDVVASELVGSFAIALVVVAGAVIGGGRLLGRRYEVRLPAPEDGAEGEGSEEPT
jgi:outer membrane protein assembly factor BamB